jgi:hypothetical protein
MESGNAIYLPTSMRLKLQKATCNWRRCKMVRKSHRKIAWETEVYIEYNIKMGLT